MFDEEAEGVFFLHDEWEDEEDQERLRDAVEAAASLGLLGDEGDDVQLPLAETSSSCGVTDVCATPPRKNIPLTSDASIEKRVAPSVETDTSLRKRLRFKQTTTWLPAPRDQKGILIDGVPVKSHPLYVRYFKMDASFRQLASRRGVLCSCWCGFAFPPPLCSLTKLSCSLVADPLSPPCHLSLFKLSAYHRGLQNSGPSDFETWF